MYSIIIYILSLYAVYVHISIFTTHTLVQYILYFCIYMKLKIFKQIERYTKIYSASAMIVFFLSVVHMAVAYPTLSRRHCHSPVAIAVDPRAAILPYYARGCNRNSSSASDFTLISSSFFLFYRLFHRNLLDRF